MKIIVRIQKNIVSKLKEILMNRLVSTNRKCKILFHNSNTTIKTSIKQKITFLIIQIIFTNKFKIKMRFNR